MTSTVDQSPGTAPPAVLDELRRQLDILQADALARLAAAALAYALATIFLPWPIVVVCAAVNLLSEILCLRLLRGLDPVADPGRYRLCMASVFSIELAFMVPPSLIWQLDGAYTKAFAVGMAAAAMMHVASMRSIHLPFGLAGLAAISLIGLGSNTFMWVSLGDYLSLLVTTICAIGALGYCLSTMVFTNRLHRQTAIGRAEAQEANAAKGRFLAQMSHELRTPMNAILGMGHAEQRRTKDPISQERLSVLIDAAESLRIILDDILDMSAVQDGRLPIRPALCDPRSEIAATVALFRPMTEGAGLSLHLDFAPDLPVLAQFDPQRLRQCLSNLLSNAVKNTPSGSIRVAVSLAISDRGETLMRVEVSDTGPGIGSGQRTAIFEPFVSGKSVLPAPGGRGLGLSISRALARQMGGDLALAPLGPLRGLLLNGAPWHSGACFVLTIALPPVACTAITETAVAPLRPGNALADMRILVVDDIATNRLVALCFLQQDGAIAIEAESGAEVLRILTETPVDLVLLDMNMPGMDGIETFARIRAMTGPAGQVPVVALTADALEEQRDAYLARGLDGYLAKPITPGRLSAELNRVLARPGPVARHRQEVVPATTG